MRPRTTFIVIAILLLLGAGVLSYLSPYRTLRKIRKAAIDHDMDALRELIDFPAVRESVKEQFKTMFTTKMLEEQRHASSQNPFEALGSSLGMMMAGPLIDSFVDSTVSPSGISAMIGGNPKTILGGKTSLARPQPAAPNAQSHAEVTGVSPLAPHPAPAREQYDSYSRFSVRFPVLPGQQTEEMRLSLRREGLFSWRLSSIRLPMPKPDPEGDNAKETMSRMRSLAIAFEASAVDHGVYPAAGSVQSALVPTYLADLSKVRVDAWGTPVRIFVSGDGKHYRFVSAGADRRFDESHWTVSAKSSNANDDIVYADGAFVTWFER